MKFSDIQGLTELKTHLINTVKNNRISHSQMLLGKDGSGNFALAIAYAQYINCLNPTDEDACGTCSSCLKYEKLVHPDLHFVFPVAKTSGLGKHEEVSCFHPYFLELWRELHLESHSHFGLNDWFEKIDIENKQAIINTRDANEIIRKLSYKSNEARYKVMIIWRTELMHHLASPKLLKIIEEPPLSTLFLFVNPKTDHILNTILSRTQLLKVRPYHDKEIHDYLLPYAKEWGEENLQYAVKQSNGSLINAKHVLERSEIEEKQFLQFRSWMRMCFGAKFLDITDFSTQMGKEGREQIKRFLHYALEMVRKSVVINYSGEEIIPISHTEAKFIQGFSPFINDKNIIEMYQLINDAIYQIERNAKADLLFVDLSIKISRLLFAGKKKNA